MFKNFSFMMYSSDINRLVDFYVAAFGFEQKYRVPADPTEPIEAAGLVFDDHELWFVLPDDPWHGLRPSDSGEPVSHVLYLKTDDVDAEVSRLRALEAPVLYEPTDHPSYAERVAYVADPDGHPILPYSDIDVSV